MGDASMMADWSDRLKYIRLGARDGWYMSIGGEIRPYYQRFQNEEWGGQPQDLNGFFLQRYMLHADLNLGSTVRVSVQSKSISRTRGTVARADQTRISLTCTRRSRT
jgi:hypothetical protein